MASLSLVDEAIAIGTVAVAAEKGGRAQEAIEKYTEACGLFIRAVQLELHPQRQSLLKAQATDFLQRAERVRPSVFPLQIISVSSDSSPQTAQIWCKFWRWRWNREQGEPRWGHFYFSRHRQRC